MLGQLGRLGQTRLGSTTPAEGGGEEPEPIDPAALFFGAGEVGVCLGTINDARSEGRLWQDAGATIPAVADGDAVVLAQDTSGGDHHITFTSVTLDQDGNGDWRLDGRSGYGQTTAIDFTGTDEMSIWLGVHKASDAATAILLELSATSASNAGSFLISAPSSSGTNKFAALFRGASTTASFNVTSTAYNAPIDAVLYTENILDTGSSTPVKVNGVLVGTGTGNAGGGTYGSYVLNIFRRNATSSQFNGYLYGLIVRGKVSTGAERVQGEHYIGEAMNKSLFGEEQHVAVLWGQSNMLARPTFDAGTTHPAGVWQWRQNSTLGVPTNPLDHRDEDVGDMGPDITFAQDYMAAADAGVNLVFVPCADGGTSYIDNNWGEGDSEYEACIARANAVIAALPNVTRVFFVGIIGETDAVNGGEATYAANLAAGVAAFRTDLVLPDAVTVVPFVLGGMCPDFYEGTAARETVQAAIEDAPNQIADCAYASSDGLVGIVGDETHFDAASLRTMGSTMNTALEGLYA